MSDANRITRNWKSGAWGAALAVLLGSFQPALPWLADLSYDLPFGLRSNIPTTNVLIIYMDKDSSDHLGQPWDSAAWDRRKHAELLQRLTDCHAKAVVFDILFESASTNGGDAPLLAAIRRATNAGTHVVVGGTSKPVTTPDKATGGGIIAPFDALEAITPWGMAEEGGEDQILRSHYPGAEDRDNWVPSLSWRAAELTTQGGPNGSPRSLRWINYYGPPRWIDNRYYEAALEPGSLPESVFSNKVCFVGSLPDKIPFAGHTRADLWRTPHSHWGYARMPGVEIIATVYLNLVRNDFLKRMPVPAELLIVLASGLLFGWGLTRFRPLLATGVGLAGILFVTAAACGLMASQHIWFSWLFVAGVQIPVSIGWSVLTNTKRLAQEKAALQTQLVAAQSAIQELTSASPEDTATRVEGGRWSERADTAAEKALAVISGTASDGQTTVPDHDLVRRVGKGAYGEVWLARNVIGTYHAVKIVKREDFQSDEPFEREFRGIQKFMPISRSHPGLVQILHAGRNQQAGYMYYIMEAGDDETTGAEIHAETYVPKNLAKEIKRRGHFPASECLQLSLDLTAALEYLHQQHLIHRDIKPANIIFVKGAPKFADIGLVTDIVATGRDATFLGTFGYIAPEGPGTPAADVYSLGKVLYEASMGLEVQKYPELPSTMMERPDHDAVFQLNQIILKACQEDRAQRYHSAAEMHDELLKLQTSLRTERKA